MIHCLPLLLLPRRGTEGVVACAVENLYFYFMNPYQLHNKPTLKDRRKELRNNATPEEQLLWQHLKQSKTGAKFRRQHSVGNYILDFYCPEHRLCIELDGSQHYTIDGIANDKERDEFLSSFEITVLRFSNREVNDNLNDVIKSIQEHF